jgi:hypothetical protein
MAGSVDDPAAALIAPSGPPVDDYFGNLVKKFPDLISPTGLVSFAIEQTIRINPLDKAKEALTGDWAGLYTCGQALINLGDCVGYLSGGVQAGSDAMFKAGAAHITAPPATKPAAGPYATPQDAPVNQQIWEGKAADSAFHYLANLVSDTATGGAGLKQLGQRYLAVSTQYQQTGDFLVSAIETVVDTLLVLAINIAAEPELAPTVFGGVIGAIGIIAELSEMAEVWDQILSKIGTLDTAARGLAGLLSTHQDISGALNFPLPGGAYDNTGVS